MGANGAAEARTEAEYFQDGSISHTILLAIAESYDRLAQREESLMPARSK